MPGLISSVDMYHIIIGLSLCVILVPALRVFFKDFFSVWLPRQKTSDSYLFHFDLETVHEKRCSVENTGIPIYFVLSYFIYVFTNVNEHQLGCLRAIQLCFQDADGLNKSQTVLNTTNTVFSVGSVLHSCVTTLVYCLNIHPQRMKKKVGGGGGAFTHSINFATGVFWRGLGGGGVGSTYSTSIQGQGLVQIKLS